MTVNKINIDGWLLNQKANISLNNVTSDAGSSLNAVGARTVTQSWSSGNSFYRVYSDGFIIQGGYVTQNSPLNVTLHKAFSNTSYDVVLTAARGDLQTVPSSAMLTVNKTTTSFQGTGSSASLAHYWVAFGF